MSNVKITKLRVIGAKHCTSNAWFEKMRNPHNLTKEEIFQLHNKKAIYIIIKHFHDSKLLMA